MTCKIDGCDKRARGRGWCAAHYWRWRKHGDPRITKQRPHRRVREIRASSDTDGVLAARFGVNRSTIRGIVNRRTWRHV